MVDRFSFKLKFHILYARWLYIINSFPFLKTCYLSILLVALTLRDSLLISKNSQANISTSTGEAHHLVGWEIVVRFLFFPLPLFSLLIFFYNDPSASTTRIQPFLSKFRFFRDKLSEGSSTNSKVLFVRLPPSSLRHPFFLLSFDLCLSNYRSR